MTPTSVCLWRHREHGDGNKRWRQRRFEPLQEMGIKKMINGNLSSEFISLLFEECVPSCKFYPKLRLASGFTLPKSTRTVTLQDAQPRNVTSALHNPGRKWQFPFGNIRKTTKNSNFKRHFLENGWSYRREILHNNQEDQVQWHISKLCSFL